MPLRNTEMSAGSEGTYGLSPFSVLSVSCRLKELTALAMVAVSRAVECVSHTSASRIGMLASATFD